jgi:hypothetical protein
MNPTAYYLPGRNEPLVSGPGEVLVASGFSVIGRTLPGDLSGLGFDDQVTRIGQDLTAQFWRADALAAGRSYGAYLLLHALADLAPFPGRVLLFSPVLGAALAQHAGGFYGAIPPRADRLAFLAREHAFPAPASIDIYLGERDTGCAVEVASAFAMSVGGRLHIVVGAGHELPLGSIEAALGNAP